MRLWRVEFSWLALVIVLLVLAVWWFPGMGSLATDSYSVAFAGKKAFFQALRRLDTDVVRNTDQLIPRPGAGDRLLILGPARNPTEKEWTALYEEVSRGATVVFAASSRDTYVNAEPFGARIKPVRSMFEELEEDEELTKEQASEDGDEAVEGQAEDSKTDGAQAEDSKAVDEKAIGDAADDEQPVGGKPSNSKAASPESGTDVAEEDVDEDEEDLMSPLDNMIAETELVEGDVEWRSAAVVELDAPHLWEVLVSADAKPQVVKRRIGTGTIVLLAADSVFSNKAMTDAAQSLLAYRIIEAAPTNERTWFDETLNSSGVPKVFGILFDPLFRPITLQLILIAALFGWSGTRRFGPATYSSETRRRSIVEHAEALGILYMRTKSGSHAVQCLHEFLNCELRSLYGAGFRVEDASTISHVVQQDETGIRALLAEVEKAKQVQINRSSAGRILRKLSMLISGIRPEK